MTQTIPARFLELFDQMIDVYEAALKAGDDQQRLFTSTRDMLMDKLGMQGQQAANLVRCIIAVVGARNGEQIYSDEEFATIVGYATGAKGSQVTPEDLRRATREDANQFAREMKERGIVVDCWTEMTGPCPTIRGQQNHRPIQETFGAGETWADVIIQAADFLGVTGCWGVVVD